VRPYLEDALGTRIHKALLLRIVPLVRERIRLLPEIVDIADFFFTDGPLDYNADTLLGKRFAGKPGEAAAALERVVAVAEGIADWTHETLESVIRPLAEELGMKVGDLFEGVFLIGSRSGTLFGCGSALAFFLAAANVVNQRNRVFELLENRILDHLGIDHVLELELVEREHADHLHQARGKDLPLRDLETQFVL